MRDFRKLLRDDNIYFFDGGYGTLLMQRGLPAGMSPELFGLKSPEVVRGVHEDYIKGGANVLTTNTFGGTAHKLGLDADTFELNKAVCELARSAGGENTYVAASIGPTGLFVKPLGDLTFRELVEAFKEQIRGCVAGGADLILGETHFDLAEARAVVLAAREVCDLPIGISMTFEAGRTLTGTDPATFVDTVQNMGVDLIATNCSAGPEQIVGVVEAMLPRLSTPLYVAANAGLPELDSDGNTVFRLPPEPFAEQSKRFAELGAKFIGGCCGTGPDHIRALSNACAGMTWKRPEPTHPALVTLTSRAESVYLGLGNPTAIIGERINPTGKKDLTAELQAGSLETAFRFAKEQLDRGAPILDVNVGAPMVDEVALLPELVTALVERHTCPMTLDSPNGEAIKAALDAYPGSPLVNSISGEPGRMAELGPICRDYGAPFILLPLKGNKLPVTSKDRIAIIDELVAEADGLGIPRSLIVVDGLALTVSSKPEAAKATLETIRYCTQMGLATTLGLSNVSFGLPARELLNSTFLALCMGAGLSSFIGNPDSARIRESLGAGEVLLNRDPQAGRYISAFSDWKPLSGSSSSAPNQATPAGGAITPPTDDPEELFAGVITGVKTDIVNRVEAALKRGCKPFALVNELMIPAIMEVGEKYEKKEFFLPQLLLSAETMQLAFGKLKPLLEAEGTEPKATVVMATVEGDIHDIGKNICCLMLKNHGFEVIDLGKDVPATAIVDAAAEHGAKIIGLSALMTTTMVRMEDTIKLVAERGLDAKVIIGGAVVTGAFSDSIGADGWSTDAVEAVKIANRLTQ